MLSSGGCVGCEMGALLYKTKSVVCHFSKTLCNLNGSYRFKTSFQNIILSCLKISKRTIFKNPIHGTQARASNLLLSVLLVGRLGGVKRNHNSWPRFASIHCRPGGKGEGERE